MEESAMLCYWLNHALCLRPENDEETEALSTLHNVFRAGLKPNPHENSSRNSELNWKNKKANSLPTS